MINNMAKLVFRYASIFSKEMEGKETITSTALEKAWKQEKLYEMYFKDAKKGTFPAGTQFLTANPFVITNGPAMMKFYSSCTTKPRLIYSV